MEAETGRRWARIGAVQYARRPVWGNNRVRGRWGIPYRQARATCLFGNRVPTPPYKISSESKLISHEGNYYMHVYREKKRREKSQTAPKFLLSLQPLLLILKCRTSLPVDGHLKFHYIQHHGGELASNFSLRALIKRARFRIRWTRPAMLLA